VDFKIATQYYQQKQQQISSLQTGYFTYPINLNQYFLLKANKLHLILLSNVFILYLCKNTK